MMRMLAGLLAVLITAAGSITARAQDYPARPVKIIVPFAVGGPADVYARVLGAHLQEAMGQPFVIENRPGAGAVTGTDAAAKAAPDGYTLLLMSNAHTVNETLIPNKPYALLRDFVPVAPINYSDLMLVVNPSVSAGTLAEFIALAKAQPGKLNYASSGPGTPYHMAGELFKTMAGVDIVHVPYKESSAARTGVIGGQVDMMFDAVTTMNEQAKAGKVKALATSGTTRSAVTPTSAHGVRGRRAGLRGDDLARRDGAEGNATGGRRASQRGDRQYREQAGDARGLGQAGRGRHDDDARGVRASTWPTISRSGIG